MRARDLLREAYHALAVNRMRSFLTILGIVIGIAAVITMTSLVSGMGRSMVGDVGGAQMRQILVVPMVPAERADYDAAAELVPGIERMHYLKTGRGEVTYRSKKLSGGNLSGVEPSYLKFMEVKMASGRAFSEADDKHAARVVLLGKGAVKELFGSEDEQAAGATVSINGESFVVAGVMEGSSNTQWHNMVAVPMNTMDQRLGGGYLQAIAEAKGEPSKQEMSKIAKSYAEMFTKLKGKAKVDETIRVSTFAEILEIVELLIGGFNMILGGVAAISLLVGGIGIMNMMLTNVTERIREIGLRKALGAHARDIVRQFLLEAVALTLIGGLVGIVVGTLGSLGIAAIIGAVNPQLSFSPYIDGTSVAWAVGVSVLIGVVFGFYPAQRAARLDPIEALRYQ
ncbi:FtsX-like permease family protein [Eggerthellaceae bacterium zg-1084]|uniref:FtsX-like permease family protein n=1 Tax=Berryella wangjianweii TaxID=2734634 RepID=A0A6M8J2E1_9ACTN|nr:ABC transporter permease [Berryella wangjianweii]NPD31301.1 FtsX-like permease family protein [Berryella wangjianweii]NPD32390.1 FtsX-like permease family protein [Eggerthellaceae bacterium zg-997]QKF06843.1 FtsX-like permease family protein [Berryella wangjianweii]